MAEKARTEETNAQRYERGEARLLKVDGQEGKQDVDALGDLGRHIYEFGYGDIYSREGLSLRDRELAAVAMLTVLGGREEQLSPAHRLGDEGRANARGDSGGHHPYSCLRWLPDGDEGDANPAPADKRVEAPARRMILNFSSGTPATHHDYERSIGT
jgi:hypothetical protein